MRTGIALLVLLLLGVGGAIAAEDQPPAAAEEGFSTYLGSVALIREDAPTGATLEGAKLSLVLYYDDHAPPMTGFLSFEYLSGDDEEQARLGASLSILEFPGGRAYSVWVRPVAGVQYREFRSGDRVDGFVGVGAEFIVRPHRRVQLAATFDRLLAFSGEETSQYGLAFRIGFGSE